MIYVEIKAIKSEGRGEAKGNGWHDTADPVEAIEIEWRRFHSMWDQLGHGLAVTYEITVAPEASPNRTRRKNQPLPVASASTRKDGA